MTDNELERRLSDELAQRAATARPDGDFDGVVRRAARADVRQRRALVIALVVVLLLGPAVGFLAGYGVRDDGSDVAADGEAGTDAAVDEDTATTAAARDDVAFGGAAGEVAATPSAGDASMLGPDVQPGEPVALRTSLDGASVRIFRLTYGPGYYGPVEGILGPPWAPDWQPAPDCNPIGNLTVGISTDLMVGTAWFELWADVPDVRVEAGVTGHEFGDPQAWVALQAGPDVARARMAFDGGAIDEMDLVEGFAVLVGSAPADGADPYTARGTLDLLAADGSVVETIAVDETIWEHSYQPWDDPDFAARCEPPAPPPVPMPEPGEQPADVAAASAAVAEAFTTVFDGSLTREERAPLIDDPLGVVDDARIAAEESFGEAVASARAQVRETVFVAPDVAVVRFDLATSMGDFADRRGEARIVDGTWKVTDATVCAALSLAAVSCDGVEPYPQPDPYAPWYSTECDGGGDCAVSSGGSESCVETPDGTVCESVATAEVVPAPPPTPIADG